MKKFTSLLFVSILGGALTLGAYKAFFDKDQIILEQRDEKPGFLTAALNSTTPTISVPENLDFTLAANKTVHAVVHVKNVSISEGPTSLRDFFYGYQGPQRAQVGTGSGVIISPDGYIVTNNHVIANASQLEVTLNDNKIFKAELVGTDPNTDIALIKIDTEDKLPYLAFGDSDNTKLGEWVLAVGNPFNLTSTVTAGIISAKARDLGGEGNQSFIQTDAAVNPGNSGGALVNTSGDLIGINTAITSQTGSYVGYSFAVPSNIAKKVVEDIMEYGNVQEGVLGVGGTELNSVNAEKLGVTESEGFYVGTVYDESGAEKAGLKEGDIIKQIDNVKISKFSDLKGFLRSKRPNDVVNVQVLRGDDLKTYPVKLFENTNYTIQALGISVKNLSDADKKSFKTKSGVKIVQTSPYMSKYGLDGKVLIAINDIEVDNISDVKEAMSEAKEYGRLSIVMLNDQGEKERLIFQ